MDGKLWKDKLLFLGLMGLFGCLGPVVREISLSSVCIVWIRACISAVSLLLFLLLSRRHYTRAELKEVLPPMLLSGALLAVDWIGLFSSYHYTTIATATLCYYIVPVLVMLGAVVFLHERLGRRQVLCSLAAFLGMALVSGVVDSGLPSLSELRGVLLALLGAAAYASIILLNKRFPKGDPLLRTLLQLATASVIMTVYTAGTTDIAALSFGVKDVLLLLLLGVVMTAIAYILYFSLIVRLPARTVAILSYADPVVAVLVSVFLLSEPIGLVGSIGAVLIIGSAVISEL